MKPPFKTAQFTVRSHEVDIFHKAKLSAVVSYFQESASAHVIDLKLTEYDLLQHNLMWVLNRQHIIMDDLPNHKSTITVETFPSGFDKFFFYRDFVMLDDTGKRIGRSTSTWLVVDTIKRKLTHIPDFIKNIPINEEREKMPVVKGKFPRIKTFSYQTERTIEWHDLDINNHTNNTHYFRWLLETLPVEVLKNNQIREIDIVFKQETQLGDKIILYAEPIDDASFFHQITSETGKVIIQAKTVWKTK